MIKKIVLWFITCVSVFVGFSSAWVVRSIWVYYPSIYNNQYDIQVIKKWSFLSQFLGTTKNAFVLDSQNLFMWDNAWRLYAHWDSYTPLYWHSFHEWFVDYFFSCDVLTWWSAWPSNCSANAVDSSTPEIYSNFLKNVTTTDYYYYNYSETWCYSNICVSQMQLCVSSFVYNKSLCWAVQHHSSSYTCPQFWGVCPTVSNSKWFWEMNFSQMNWSPSPAVDWSINWGSNSAITVDLSWNIVYNDCTNWYIIQELEKQWWYTLPYVCYAWINSTWLELDDQIVTVNTILSLSKPWYWLDFKELYKLTRGYETFSEWFITNNDIFKRYKLWKFGDNNPFIGHPWALYSYFNILWDNWYNWLISPEVVANYCKIKVFWDYTQSYTWKYFKSLCKSLDYSNSSDNYTTWSVWSVEDDEEILPPWFDEWWDDSVTSSWTVLSVDWSWTLSWETNKNFEWRTFINDVYQKLQTKFRKPYNDVTWIIPWYILVALCGLILFRFLSH